MPVNFHQSIDSILNNSVPSKRKLPPDRPASAGFPPASATKKERKDMSLVMLDPLDKITDREYRTPITDPVLYKPQASATAGPIITQADRQLQADLNRMGIDVELRKIQVCASIHA